MRERFVRGRSFKISLTIENALGDDVCARRDSKAVKRSALVRLTRCTIACDNPGDMRAVAMFIGGVRQIAIIEERIGAACQIRVHGRSFSGVQTAVGDGDAHATAVISEALHQREIRAAVASYDL